MSIPSHSLKLRWQFAYSFSDVSRLYLWMTILSDSSVWALWGNMLTALVPDWLAESRCYAHVLGKLVGEVIYMPHPNITSPIFTHGVLAVKKCQCRFTVQKFFALKMAHWLPSGVDSGLRRHGEAVEDPVHRVFRQEPDERGPSVPRTCSPHPSLPGWNQCPAPLL